MNDPIVERMGGAGEALRFLSRLAEAERARLDARARLIAARQEAHRKTTLEKAGAFSTKLKKVIEPEAKEELVFATNCHAKAKADLENLISEVRDAGPLFREALGKQGGAAHVEATEAESAATLTHDAGEGRPGPANDRGGPDAGLRDGLPRRDAASGAGVAPGRAAERAVTPGTTPCGIAGALLDGESPEGLALNGGALGTEMPDVDAGTAKTLIDDGKQGKKSRRRKGVAKP